MARGSDKRRGDYPNSGALFRNDRRETDKQPEYTGRAEVDGVDYWISAWVNEGKKGKFFSIKFKPVDDDRRGGGGGRDRDDDRRSSRRRDDDDPLADDRPSRSRSRDDRDDRGRSRDRDDDRPARRRDHDLDPPADDPRDPGPSDQPGPDDLDDEIPF